MTVFLTSEIGTIAQRAESSGALLFAREKEPTDCFAGGQKEAPNTIRGDTHTYIHEMVSKPLIRKGLRLVGCADRAETLVRVGKTALFM